jgi:hypothetical protein
MARGPATASTPRPLAYCGKGLGFCSVHSKTAVKKESPMTQSNDQLREMVRQKYAEIITTPLTGCGTSCCETGEQSGFDNVEFRLGEIEHLPVRSDSMMSSSQTAYSTWYRTNNVLLRRFTAY